MSVEIAGRYLGKAGVEIGDEGGRIRVGVAHQADAAQAQLLHQPVLQGPIHPFDTALGLA
ncbi:hypothetical protein FHX63_004934 [Cupriavidus plantarum]|uniref:hypothetical protein n=1 Tax=Cupriavidus plantarum TaxID=942865 RepID=UPI0018068EDF|nr:hypothetical protein [Cupriavidus plantarum]